MKILCPYVNLNPATEWVLQTEHFNDTLFAYVGNTEYDYFELVYRHWKIGEKFIVVEQDIIPWPGLLTQLDSCFADLCLVFAPHGPGDDLAGYSYGWGIWRFNSSLLQSHRYHLDDPKLTRKWSRIDGEVVTRLIEGNIATPHIHNPPVVHMNRNRFPLRPSRIRQTP